MKKQRKFVYVLGAGASLAAGAVARVQRGGKIPIPTQMSFWPTILRFCGQKRQRELEQFLFQYFLGYERVPARLSHADRAEMLRLVDVEEVFTFLSERARAPSTLPQSRARMEEVWQTLVQSIGSVFRRFPANAGTRAAYDKLRRNQFKSRDVVVSFNYDTVFETSLTNGVSWGYSCIEDVRNALPVLKPHGSINWQLDNDLAIRVTTTPAMSPVIVAPTHLKFVAYSSGGASSVNDLETHPVGYLDQSADIQKIWTEMERQMRAARALIFIGYSFPPADLYFSSVLRSVLAARSTNPDVVVVNPDAIAISQRLKQRFALDKIVKYFDLAQFSAVSRIDVIRELEK